MKFSARLIPLPMRHVHRIKAADKSAGEGMVAKLSQDSINRELTKVLFVICPPTAYPCPVSIYDSRHNVWSRI